MHWNSVGCIHTYGAAVIQVVHNINKRSYFSVATNSCTSIGIFNFSILIVCHSCVYIFAACSSGISCYRVIWIISSVRAFDARFGGSSILKLGNGLNEPLGLC